MRTLSITILACLALLVPRAHAVQDASGLDARIERLDLRDVQMREALRLIAEESGVNLIPSEEAGKKVISCFVQDTSVRGAIESIAKAYGMWYREDERLGAVRVMTAEEYERDLSLFRDESTRIFTLMYPNALEVALAIRNLFGARVHLSLDREIRYEEYSDISQRFQRFDLLDSRTQGLSGANNQNNSSLYNNQRLGEQSNITTVGDTSYSGRDQRYDNEQQQNAEPLNLSADQLQRVEDLLKSSGAVDPGMIERLRGAPATIYVSIMRRNNQVAVRSGDLRALEEIERIVHSLDVPTPQVLLEVKILELDLGDDFQSAFDFDFQDSKTGTRFREGSIANGTGLIDPGALVYTFIDGNLQARLQFLQDNKRVTTLATPLLLVANNEVSRLFIGEERPIVQNITSQTVVNSNVTTTTPNTQIEMRPVGTTLLLTPNINADRTVTLRVLQETSDVKTAGATIPIIVSDGTVVDQPVDVVASRTVTGTVVAKDGLTLALGGLIEEGVSDSQAGVPGLMDLPLIGVLFRREQKQRFRRELVVLIRPRVLFTANEGQQWSEELANRMSIHPAAGSDAALGSFERNEVPRPPLARKPLREMLKYQSGLPDGQ